MAYGYGCITHEAGRAFSRRLLPFFCFYIIKTWKSVCACVCACVHECRMHASREAIKANYNNPRI
jgi:hypothetical protein